MAKIARFPKEIIDNALTFKQDLVNGESIPFKFKEDVLKGLMQRCRRCF